MRLYIINYEELKPIILSGVISKEASEILLTKGHFKDQLDILQNSIESVKEMIKHLTEVWSNVIVNDFEKPIIQQYPEIGKIKENMLAKGAIFSSMSGTGSTIFGIFKEKNTHISFPSHYFQYWFSVK